MSKDASGNYHHRLHALDLTTGGEEFSGQRVKGQQVALRALSQRVAVLKLVKLFAVVAVYQVGELMHHELRWARTLRLLSPWGYAGLVLTHALPLALIAAALGGFGATSWATIALALACRLSIPIQIRALSFGGDAWPWLSPIRDLLSFAVFLASFLPRPLS
jgi:hypothetical protein